MSEPKSIAAESPLNRGWWWETALLVLLCYLKAGWLPPDVNEAHYLCKAKHYWDPSWVAHDFFLNSADAHAPFYFVFGWITLVASLPAAAWIGRFVTWTLIALAWQRLSWRVTPVPFAAVISGGLMIVLTTVGHMAGEWIIGGVEAKGFAFALLFLALEQLLRGRWNAVFVLLGAASAMHVLVGGWSVVAAAIAWLLLTKDRTTLVKILPGLAGGFALSLIGLLPVLLLNQGIDAETVREANRIYVFDRLPHHLVFNQFPHLWMARHAALAVVFFALVMWARRRQSREISGQVTALAAFVAGSVAIAIIGIVIDQATLYHDLLAAKLLRFYWFRLSDVMIPCGVALLVPYVLFKAATTGRGVPADDAGMQARSEQRQTFGTTPRPVVAALGALAFVPILAWNYERQQHPLPGSALQSWQQQRDGSSLADAEARLADWQAVCQWIRENTPEEAIFLTPRAQQTFKWYAHRAEVVAMKDIPQDARGIVEWQRRVNDVFAPPVSTQGYSALTDEQITLLANRHGASYVIVDDFTRIPRLQRVYPPPGEAPTMFAVYQVTSPDDRR